MAEEKLRETKAIRRRRILWQLTIFGIALAINILIAYRERFILDDNERKPDSDIRLATNLCRGIGFIVIGNLYDNVTRPKRLTFIVLLCLSASTMLVSLVAYKWLRRVQCQAWGRLLTTHRSSTFRMRASTPLNQEFS